MNTTICISADIIVHPKGRLCKDTVPPFLPANTRGEDLGQIRPARPMRIGLFAEWPARSPQWLIRLLLYIYTYITVIYDNIWHITLILLYYNLSIIIQFNYMTIRYLVAHSVVSGLSSSPPLQGAGAPFWGLIVMNSPWDEPPLVPCYTWGVKIIWVQVWPTLAKSNHYNSHYITIIIVII